MVSGPAVQPFRPEPAVVNAIDRAAADADDSAAVYSDVEPASVRAEDAGRLHPMCRLFDRALVDALRPTFEIRRPFAPDVRYAIPGCFHRLLSEKRECTLRSKAVTHWPRRMVVPVARKEAVCL